MEYDDYIEMELMAGCSDPNAALRAYLNAHERYMKELALQIMIQAIDRNRKLTACQYLRSEGAIR